MCLWRKKERPSLKLFRATTCIDDVIMIDAKILISLFCINIVTEFALIKNVKSVFTEFAALGPNWGCWCRDFMLKVYTAMNSHISNIPLNAATLILEAFRTSHRKEPSLYNPTGIFSVLIIQVIPGSFFTWLPLISLPTYICYLQLWFTLAAFILVKYTKLINGCTTNHSF